MSEPSKKKNGLLEGEEILWEHKIPASTQAAHSMPNLIFLLISIFLFIILINISGIAYIFLLPVAFFINSKLTTSEKTTTPSRYFAFTNKRLLLEESLVHGIPLERIESAFVSRTNILLQGKNSQGHSTHLLSIENVPNFQAAQRNIEAILRKHGAYSKLDRTFAKLASKYKLKRRSNLLHDTDKEVMLEGDAGQFKIQYAITPYGKNGSYVDLHINFPNPTDYYLSLLPESTIPSISKKFGLGDLEVGDNKFDDEFYIQTNNSTETLKILSPDLQKKIYQLYSQASFTTCLVGTFVKAPKVPKEKKQKFKDNSNILDMHLLGENVVESKENLTLRYNEKRRSDLVFSSQYDIPLSEMAEKSQQVLETFLTLVNKVETSV